MARYINPRRRVRAVVAILMEEIFHDEDLPENKTCAQVFDVSPEE